MFRFGVMIGFGIGYVLGTKAGRERYYQILRAWQDVTGDERIQQVIEKGKAVVDLSTERARQSVGEGISAASRKVRQAAEGDGEHPAA